MKALFVKKTAFVHVSKNNITYYPSHGFSLLLRKEEMYATEVYVDEFHINAVLLV